MKYLDIQYEDGTVRRHYLNGDKVWYKNGKIHRDNDLPAQVDANGHKAWYKNGKQHRDNDLPAVEYTDGDKYWFKNGKEYKPKNK